MVLTALALAVSPTLAAQQGLNPVAGLEGPLRERVPVEEDVRTVVLYEAGDMSILDTRSSDVDARSSGAPEPAGASSTAVTEYRYDDGNPETYSRVLNAYEQEYAQRFRLSGAGTVVSAMACFFRTREDGDADLSFVLTFYRDSGGGPGGRLASYSGEISVYRLRCATVDSGDIVRQRLPAGDVWLGVRWRNSGDGENFVAEDRGGSGGTRNFWRARSSADDRWSFWVPNTAVSAYYIRLGVDHGGTPAPDPPACTPTTTALRFDGGYDVSMCWRAPDGREGQARSGIWASSQAGLLWFFDRENAEVLVKVLDGCAYNGHRWVFVGPVTDLEFNLRISGPDGRRWTHGNRQGKVASARADTLAFPCANDLGVYVASAGGSPHDGVGVGAATHDSVKLATQPGCFPTTTALRFDGGYEVRMCWWTYGIGGGEARSGIWASGQAGLLWFFDRENAEVLVKVLDGCALNGHRWVYVAPVTDMGFDLWIHGPDGRSWTHRNVKGRTATTRADTRAFPCSNEDDGDKVNAMRNAGGRAVGVGSDALYSAP